MLEGDSKYDILEPGYESLARRVILFAYRDIERNWNNPKNSNRISAEAFLRSQAYEAFSNLDGEYIIQTALEVGEEKAMRRKYKSRKKCGSI